MNKTSTDVRAFGRIALTIATAVCAGALAACSAPADPGAEPAAVASKTAVTRPPSSPAPQARGTVKTPTSTTPATTKKIVIETRRIPFKQVTVADPTLDKGTTVVTTRGVRGVERLTFEVTLANGKVIARRLLRTEVTKRPVTQVRAVGTKVAEPEPAGDCDPNYSGCVPIASDVDCAGGSGNGPAYVEGPVDVIGSDIYGLDRDNDGVGCEN